MTTSLRLWRSSLIGPYPERLKLMSSSCCTEAHPICLTGGRSEGQLGKVLHGAEHLHSQDEYTELTGGCLLLADMRGLIPVMEDLVPGYVHARTASHALETCCLVVPGT